MSSNWKSHNAHCDVVYRLGVQFEATRTRLLDTFMHCSNKTSMIESAKRAIALIVL